MTDITTEVMRLASLALLVEGIRDVVDEGEPA